MLLYPGLSPIMFSGTPSQVSGHRIAAFVSSKSFLPLPVSHAKAWEKKYAPCGFRSDKEFVKAGVAVGLAILLLEDAIVQLGEAKGTDKVLRVELVPHGTDTAPHNGLPTAKAHCSLVVVVVKLTIGTSV